jgi:AcrR family transcriptional regulator
VADRAGALTKAIVIEQAAQLFRQHGYRAARLEDIGAELGVSRAALYYHVESKEAILLEIIRQVVEDATSRVERIVASDLPAAEALREMIAGHIEYMSDNLDLVAVFLQEVPQLPEDRYRDVMQKSRRYTDLIVATVKRGVADGTFSEDLDPVLATFGFLGAMNWTYRWFDSGGSWTPDTVRDQLTSLVLDGLLTRKETAGRSAPGIVEEEGTKRVD